MFGILTNSYKPYKMVVKLNMIKSLELALNTSRLILKQCPYVKYKVVDGRLRRCFFEHKLVLLCPVNMIQRINKQTSFLVRRRN